MTPTLLIDLFSEQRLFISNLCTFFGIPGIKIFEMRIQTMHNDQDNKM